MRQAIRSMSFKSGSSAPNVAVVGATGAVGMDLLRILEERSFPVEKVRG